jgi:hypothetical protein
LLPIKFTTETINTYDNDSAKWHLGRLKTAKVTHGAINTPSITRTSSFTYNSDGLTISRILNGCTSAYNTTACYCAFGFVTKTDALRRQDRFSELLATFELLGIDVSQ